MSVSNLRDNNICMPIITLLCDIYNFTVQSKSIQITSRYYSNLFILTTYLFIYIQLKLLPHILN